MIARLHDGLPLAASVQDHDQVSSPVFNDLFQSVRALQCFTRLIVKCDSHRFAFLLSLFKSLPFFSGHAQIGRAVIEYQNKAKLLFRKLNHESPTHMTIAIDSYFFQ